MWWHIMKMTVTDTHYNTQSFNPEGEFTEEAIWIHNGVKIFLKSRSNVTHSLISITTLLHI